MIFFVLTSFKRHTEHFLSSVLAFFLLNVKHAILDHFFRSPLKACGV